jgi:GNAT superfamily N-acetyltransferase
MEFELLGWPSDGPTLELDWRRFSYAGKFVMSSTGKAVAREDGAVVGAVAFNEDRTDPDTLWFRYVTVREDRRGEGVGPQLLDFALGRASGRAYGRVKIAVNNPFAYEACYRAGFAFTGETTGIAELVLAWTPGSDADEDSDSYGDGLDRFRERDLSEEEVAFLAERAQCLSPNDSPDAR